VLGRIFLAPLGVTIYLLIRYRFKLTVANQSVIRQRFRQVFGEGKPVVICSNHLTLVDSVLIAWALAPISFYVWNFRALPWNIPAIENYCRRPSWRLLTFLAKCIPIDRTGSRGHLNLVVDKLAYVLTRGHACLLFPEGTRSRSGRFDHQGVGYGVGKLIERIPGCRILCVYLRGQEQASYSDFPQKGDRLFVDMVVLNPERLGTGMRAIRTHSQAVAGCLRRMEERYYASLQAGIPG
jgi:hypothetical protein